MSYSKHYLTLSTYNLEHPPIKLAILHFHAHLVSTVISSGFKSYTEISSVAKSLCDTDPIFPWLSKRGNSDSLQIYPWRDTVWYTLLILVGTFSFILLLSKKTRGEDTLAESCSPNVKTNFPTCCCSDCVQIRSGPQRGKALMFGVCVNTTRERRRVHMAPTIEHQFHWNTVV